MFKGVRLYNGVDMPSIGLGTSKLFGNVLTKIVGVAKKNGITMFDTAYNYGNEQDLSVALKKNAIDREEIFLTSKMSSVEYLGRKRYFHIDKRSVSKSLRYTCKRLNTEYVDLYMLHSTEFEHWQNAYEELFEMYHAGRIKAVGVCNITLEKLSYLVETMALKPMVVQIEITPYYIKKELVDYCHENGIAVVAHSQFAKGNPLLLIDPILNRIAKRYNKSLQQVILRWLVQRNIVIIPRTSSPTNLMSNLDIFNFKLSDEDMADINGINKNFSFWRP